MNPTAPTGRQGEFWLSLLCRLLLVTVAGGILAGIIFASSVPIAVLSTLLVLCLVVCLILLSCGQNTARELTRALEDEERRRASEKLL